jgi:hypothetical protein
MTYLNEIVYKENSRPHLVILGAGASRACLPNGDAYGKKLPLMNDLVEILNLEDLIKKSNVNSSPRNFEEFYSKIHETNNHKLINGIQNRVNEYFENLYLPEEPTLYDYLICSLRGKDYIATFNWDPLLMQAFLRCPFDVANKPKLIFLHGNVMVGMAEEEQVCGLLMNRYTENGFVLKPVNLLYPVTQKNYNNNRFIKGQWHEFKKVLKRSYYITIFGYGVPESDIEAKQNMLEAWNINEVKELGQFEIINTDVEAVKKWGDFIIEHHYNNYSSYFDSMLAHYPRRTSEYLWEWTQECKFLTPERMPQFDNRSLLYEWFGLCLEQEKKLSTNNVPKVGF